MFKYKIKLILLEILALASLALPCFNFENVRYSILSCIFETEAMLKNGQSMWLISVLILYLLFFILTTITLLFLKEKNLKLKCTLLSLLNFSLYAAIIFYVIPKIANMTYHLTWGSFIVLILQGIILIASLILPISKKQNTALEKEEIKDDEQTVMLPAAYQENTDEKQLNEDQKAIPECKNERPHPKELLTLDNVKQLSKILVLINLAMFFSFFLIWNSDITKATGLILFLKGNSWIDIISRLMLLGIIHLAASNLLFFNHREYLIAASFLNDIFVILAWLRAVSLIGFVNIALAPLIALLLAVLSFVMIIFSIRQINHDSFQSLSLKDMLMGYLKALITFFKQIFSQLQKMLEEWKD